MERIKDLTKIVLRGDLILAKIYNLKTSLIISKESKSGVDYLETVTVGNNITDIKPGDIILDVSGKMEGYSIHGEDYTIIHRQNVQMAVPRDNFEFKDTKIKAELKS